jgi:Tfp pilus assembly protein PilV
MLKRTKGLREARRAGRAEGARGEAGFTILETVIALFVMLLVGLGAVAFFVYSTTFNSGASDRARALAIAQQKMEALRAADYSTFTNISSNAAYNGTVTSGSTTAADPRTFTVTTTATDDPTVSNSRQKIITVTVTPKAAGWSAGSVTLRSTRAKNELGTN